jgi:LysM repeat protein
MPERHQPSLRLLILLTALVSVFLLVTARVEAGEPPVPPVPYRVEVGDTLWEIAAGVAGPDEDVRSVVARLMSDNGLSTAAIRPGQVLMISGVES